MCRKNDQQTDTPTFRFRCADPQTTSWEYSRRGSPSRITKSQDSAVSSPECWVGDLADNTCDFVRLPGQFYMNCCAALVFMTFLTIAIRRIFSETTLAGVQRQQNRMATSSVVSLVGTVRRKRQCRRLLRVMFQVYPGMLWNAFSGVYVQVTTANMPTTQRDLAIFAICSLGLKLLIQELVKEVIVKRKVKDIRTMFLVVGIPTVLIDTQVRVMLQLDNNVSTTVGGSIAMAFAEVALQSGKMIFLRTQIDRKARRTYTSLTPNKTSITKSATIHPTTTREATTPSPQAFEVWKMQVLRFHAAEAYADMAAEYMSMGSSAIIVAIYDEHPKYQLSQWQVRAAHEGTGGSVSDSRYFILLVFQIALEFVVETAHGANFDQLKKYESYVMALFVVVDVMNVRITAIMYLKCE